MPVFLPPGCDIHFPPPAAASPEGLLAVGGDLSVPRLLAAYRQGVFPWYNDDTPILWWNLPERSILVPEELHIPHSLRRTINARRFQISLDWAFADVITACAGTRRPGQQGSWIVPAMREAYTALHEAGYAHSVEAWEGGQLVGGAYGVALGRAFFGESMFFKKPDASKTAFVWLVRYLAAQGYALIDCQQVTEHTSRFGAVSIDRDSFMCSLKNALVGDDRAGRWQLPDDFFPL
ncbi:leucyl/phenylalanyl-tRNA--protein transferase [Desulfovibrio sp. OttesenSCG-928-I05]|nr:leucyl/phenylalanyl-tRNA--protein transferase [Desulfovibrio sp. OttesenSCG-928-I05]